MAKTHGKYLGEEIVPLCETPYALHSSTTLALEYIERYGQTDGDHHKAWVLDQVARLLMGTPLVVTRATWEGGEIEWRISTGPPSPLYLKWVEKAQVERYYDEGVAP